MAIDPRAVGTELEPVTMDVERGRLRSFAKAIGETNQIYFDVDIAREAGYPDIPAPPTFLCALMLERPDPFDWLADLGVELQRILHGEQKFTYHAMVYAGSRLTARSRIVDVYAKKGGALEFIVRETEVTNGDGTKVAELNDVVIVRNPEVRA
ncbi:MAG: MaoC family dehydratase N-terminal domain-containing protein [Nocardiopsaceae bacterium]|nr:MaoC family dehydratase N-terminal domain-containing protein [Nocardiopsaceae bacterium]